MNKNKTTKTVYGVGVLGKGKYSAGKNKSAYAMWFGILARCYSVRSLMINKSYIGCLVCDEWLNFQIFAEFYYENNPLKGWQIDKDILCKENKIYSPDTCLIVPPDINKLFVRRKLHRGILPIGVHYERNRNRYKASLHDGTGKTKFLGRFLTIEEAFAAYKSHKEYIIKQKALQYKDIIPKRLFIALMNYQVEITD